MSVTEKTIQEGVQDVLQALVGFAAADVTINDWTILDQTVASGPYAIVRNSDTFTNDASINTNSKFDLPIEIYTAFTEWSTSLNAFRDTRQTVIDAFVGANRSIGQAGMLVREIRNGGEIEYYYDPYLEDKTNADPVFVAQEIILACEEF